MSNSASRLDPASALRSLTRWKLNASNEDMAKLFFSFPGFGEIEGGHASVVLGRKGSGKAAICTHLSKKTRPNRKSVTLSFKDFPFNQLYKLSDSTMSPASQYINVWKLIILSAICWLLSKDSQVGYQLRRKLSTHFSDDPVRALSTTLTKWTTGKIEIPDFGLGSGGATVERERQQNDQSLGERVARLEEFVMNNMPNSEYFILFDNLHEDYSGEKGSGEDSAYFRLLTGLISGATNLSSKFKDQKKKLHPVVFVRDDIYDRLQHSDKNHWEDQLFRLHWDPSTLWSMVAYRICAEAGVSFRSDAYIQLIDASAPRVSKMKEQHHVPLIDYVMELTQYRPRDVLMLLKVAATDALKRGSNVIQTFDITSAERTYSPYLKQEFEDEIHLIVPDYWRIISIFEQLRRGIVSYEDMISFIADDAPNASTVRPRELLELLYQFGIVGAGHEKPRFSYMDRAAKFGTPARIFVHPGLRASLGFV
jgi:hypothetical protein